MDYCIANIINFVLIKSFHNVQKAKFKHILNYIEKARGTLSVPRFLQASIHFHLAESTLWTEVGQHTGLRQSQEMENSSLAAFQTGQIM